MTCLPNRIAADTDLPLPKRMRAIGMTRLPKVGGVGPAIELLDLPTPRPKPGEVLVRVEASAMHIDDIHIAQGTALGRFLGPKRVTAAYPHVLGSTVAGAVIQVGADVEGLTPGDAVLSVHNATGDCGSWAE